MAIVKEKRFLIDVDGDYIAPELLELGQQFIYAASPPKPIQSWGESQCQQEYGNWRDELTPEELFD